MFNEASIKLAIAKLDHERGVYTLLNDQASLYAIVRHKIMLQLRLDAILRANCGGN